MSFQWNPYIIPLLIAGISSVILAIQQFRQIKLHEYKIVFLILVFSAIWVLGYACELSSTQLDVMLFWSQVQMLGVISVPTLFLVYVVQSLGRREWLQTRNLILLGYVPVLFFVLVLMVPGHNLIWESHSVVEFDHNLYLSKENGIILSVVFIYSTLLVLIAEGILIYTINRSLIYYRSFLVTMMVAGILPFAVGALDLLDIYPNPFITFTGLATSITALAVVYNLERIRRGDLASVSRTATFTLLSDGVIVLDDLQRIVDFNQRCVEIFQCNREDVLMTPISQFWPDWHQVKSVLGDGSDHKSITWQFDDNYIGDVSISSLFDWRDVYIGEIVQFREITEYQQRTDEISALLEISNAVSSTLDLNQVLLILANKLLEISKLHICTISEWKPGWEWVRGLVERSLVFYSNSNDRYDVSEYPIAQKVLTSGSPVVIGEGADYIGGVLRDKIGIGTLLMLPLHSQAEVIGLVKLGSTIDKEITGDDIVLCQEILDEASHWLERPLNNGDKDGLLGLAKSLIVNGWGTQTSISEWNPVQNFIWTVAECSELVWNLGEGPISHLEDWPTAARVIKRGRGEIILRSDPRYVPGDRGEIETWGAQMVVVLPLSIKGDPIGIVELYDVNEERLVTIEELQLWQAVADQAAIAITNARLYERAQEEIKERRKVEEKLRHDAYHDALTGLPNRALLIDRLKRTLNRSRRSADNRWAVLFLDLDDFKNVNDSYGHAAGDMLLVEIARRLEAHLRDVDTISRLGGDEFVLLVEGVSDDHFVTYIADRVKTCLYTPFNLGGIDIRTSPSIGIVIDDGSYDHPEEILRDADIALYRAKDMGKARYEIFNQGMRENILTRLQLESDLQNAIEAEKLSMVYQPIVDIVTGSLVGCEALARWVNPMGTAIGPGTFIPIAEETGLIVPLGNWIFDQACSQLKEWREKYAVMDSIPISLNLSSVQIFQPDLVDFVQKLLIEHGLNGESLSMEITEKTIIKDLDRVSVVIDQLKLLGIQIHLDDFGQGYSSLSYISQLPLDAIKIDGIFISQFENPDLRGIIKFIVSMSHDLGKHVIAEGVETLAQQEYLKEIGCEYGQGYLYAEALAANDFEARFLRYRKIRK